MSVVEFMTKIAGCSLPVKITNAVISDGLNRGAVASDRGLASNTGDSKLEAAAMAGLLIRELMKAPDEEINGYARRVIAERVSVANW